MTTVADIVELVSQRSGNRDDLETRIIREIQFVQKNVLEGSGTFRPWFLQSEPTTLVTTSGDSDLAFPADYLDELEESKLWYQDSSGSWHGLKKKPYDNVVEKDLESGPPQYYVIGATGFYLFPVPDAVYTLRFRYYKKDEVLSLTTDTNLWLEFAEDLVIGEVGYNINTFHTIDPGAAASFRAMADVAARRLFVLNEAKRNVNRVYEMGN